MHTATRQIRPSNLGVALAAVISAVTAQWLLGHGLALVGGLLYAVAVALIVFALRRPPGPLPPASLPPRGRRPRALLCLGMALLCLGGAIGLSSLRLFSTPLGGVQPWLWYLIAALVFLLGAVILDVGQGGVPGEERWSGSQLCLLLAIVVLAALVRTWDLDRLPFGTWYDEAENGLTALRVLEEPAYKPVYEARVNSAGHYLLLLASSLRLFGVSTVSLRLVSALMGTASVAAGYVVGREMFGRRWGLVLAFLLAVSRWSINFSRIGMYNTSTPLFELMALGFLLRGLRRHRYLDFALSGLALGLGMVFYTGFLPFPLILLVFLLHTAVGERRVLRGNWGGLVVLALAALLIVSPVAQYAAESEETFLERVRKTSVLRGKSGEQALLAMGQSTIKYLLMFNYRGDRYGRHNLSGEPMLDPLSGALMVLGVGLCLWRWRRPRSLLLPLWLLAMVVPGILSLEWEAPQALRSIGALAPASLLATSVLHDLGEEWGGALGRRARVPSGLLVGLALGVVACSNLHTYFVVQARDYESWRDFSTAETITARLMSELGNSVDYYVISYFHDHPVVRFLAPEVTEYHRIETHEDLPLPQVSDREVVIVLDGRSTRLREEAQLYYPRATLAEYASPSGGPPVVYTIRLSPEDVVGTQGLVGRYRRGDDWTADPVLVRQDHQLFFQWSDGVPLDLPFLAEWEGVLRAPEYGAYGLVLRAPARAELYLDGALVMEGEGGTYIEVV
ncbi:MAG TPA: glycosyltransferase family 39 protein, partial [Anaerolineae bacterium]|nr:glycosyltransferase family 39 protein [Anaerolineae bacterium]